MAKRAVGLLIVILMLCLAGCGNTQTDCERVILSFTDGNPVEFDRIISSDEESNAWRQAYYSGDYVFTDD